jgi:hypothetical protein
MSQNTTNPIVNNVFSSPWYYKVFYNDGTTVDINNIMPSNIDREKVSEVQFYLNGELHSAFDFQKDMRLIMLYRTFMFKQSGANDENQNETVSQFKVIIFGWQSTVGEGENKRNVKTIFEFYPDGIVFVRNRDIARE